MKNLLAVFSVLWFVSGCATPQPRLLDWMIKDGRPSDRPRWQGILLVSRPEPNKPPVAVFYMGAVPMDVSNTQVEVGKKVGNTYKFKSPAGTAFAEVRLEGEDILLETLLPTGCREVYLLEPIGPGGLYTPQQKIRGQLYSLQKSAGGTECGGGR